MKKGFIPKCFSFESTKDLIRVGKENDGGYLVSKKDIKNADVLVGLGINDDWSFEEEFRNIKDVPVYAYDGSIDAKQFFKNFVKSICKLNNPVITLKNLWTIFSYLIFFSKSEVTHIKKFVDFNSYNSNHISMQKVFENIKNTNIFFKIDIEGSEYRILETLLLNQSRICGLVIEFHDIDLHLDKIEKFIRDFSLNLVHIHANNCGDFIMENSMPLVLELTFSKYSSATTKISLPHELDNPNCNQNEEIQLIIG